MSEQRFVQWAWRWALLFLVLSSAAYVFAYLAAPGGQVFLGFLVNNDDNQLYLSFMRDGARGSWLTTIRTTPEAHHPALLLPGYLVLGKVARALGLSNEWGFHLARLLGGVLLLVVAYWFVVLCLPTDEMRQSALLLVAFSSGLGWLLVVTRLADRVIVPVDIRMPEASTFLTAYSSPHFALGVTLQLLTFICYLCARRCPWALLGGAVSLLLLSITLVYNVIVVAAAIGSYVLIRCWQRRTLWTPELWRAVAIGMPSIPAILYYVALLRLDPFWRVAYGEHDVVRTPGPLALALGYGLVVWLAVWGAVIWAKTRRWSSPRLLLVCWVVSNGALLYAPLAFQGKLAAGWHIGLSVLAAVGLHEGLLAWVRGRWGRRESADEGRRATGVVATVRNVALILTVPSTLLVSLVGLRVALAERYFPYFLPAEDVEAVAWLDAHAGKADVVLAAYGIGNYAAAHTGARSFLGHQFAVIDPRGKDRALRHFYSAAAVDEERRALVSSYGITFVYYGAHERRLGAAEAGPPFDPKSAPWLVRVYEEGQTAIYRVHVQSGRDLSGVQGRG